MASRRMVEEPAKSRRPPATTPEARENQMVAAAVDLAEKQIREGVASSQVITHYLKLGSSREKLEQQRLHYENELLIAKKEQMEATARIEDLYVGAIAAMRSYTGQEPPPEDEEDYDD